MEMISQNWIEYHGDFYNIDQFFHVWIEEKYDGTFYVCGDTQVDSDVVLMDGFKEKKEAIEFLRSKFQIGSQRAK